MDFVAGVIIAALAGMGIGGGGLLVLYLVFIKNMEQLEAQGLNLVFFICASLTALLYHKRKREINKKAAAVMMGTGTLGAVVGAMTASALEGQTVRKLFGWFLIAAGAVVVLNLKKK